MLISTLITSLPDAEVIGDKNVKIDGIAYHSENIKEGFLFAALSGERFDGHDFVDKAHKKGAQAIIVDRFVKGLEGVTQIKVTDTRKALARLSSLFYDEPSKRLRLVGVTGTNGKTTTTLLLESILKQAGRKTGVIGTIDYHFSGKSFKATNTTPESLDLQKLLHNMVVNGVEDSVIEVSSHALSMKRIEGLRFEGGIFTNLSQDHLDFHGDMDSYFQSKALFFKDILRGDSYNSPFSVVNIDDPKGEKLISSDSVRIFTYGMDERADIVPKDITFSENGIKCTLNTPVGKIRVTSHLIGHFNLYNIMAAVGAGIFLDLPTEAIEAGIESVKRVIGRMERFSSKDGFDVVVDYAHTADALKNVMLSLKAFNNGRLITVFGCGGERDKGKRQIMGKVSAEGSDITVITSDNPRGEEPQRIIQDIEMGLKEVGIRKINGSLNKREYYRISMEEKIYMIEPDRREAIRLAIAVARDGDTILVAGKGHERYQVIGKEVIPFDDRFEVERALEE